MIYLDALRSHLPQDCQMHGCLTNIDNFIFYVAHGNFTFQESRPICDPHQIALFLHAMFQGALATNAQIDERDPTRSILNPVDTAGPEPSILPDQVVDDDIGPPGGEAGPKDNDVAEPETDLGAAFQQYSTGAAPSSKFPLYPLPLTSTTLRIHDILVS